jgi:hypothetical protein
MPEESRGPFDQMVARGVVRWIEIGPLIFHWDGSRGEATGVYLDDLSYQ